MNKKIIKNINEEIQEIKLCKDCLIEVSYYENDIDWIFECSNCKKNDFTTKWWLEIIYWIKKNIYIEEIIIEL